MTERHRPRIHRAAAPRALAAELGHEISGGLGLFRLAAERMARGEPLDSEERTALLDELERLSQLARRLRDFARIPLRRSEHSLRAVVDAACQLASSLERALSLELQFDGDDEVLLSCDLDLLAQGLAELIDNALDARSERAGLRVTSGHVVTFCVWDDGAGFEQGLEQAARWGTTTRQGALGLGLTLALRCARAHGFALNFERDSERTLATLRVPARDVTSNRGKGAQ